MLRILIADDHGLLRAGLRSLLKSEPEMEVVGEAADGDQALVLSAELTPDVVIADISMPGPSGIEVARELKHTLPRTRVLITTMHEDPVLLQEALQAGAAGYLIKRAAESDLIRAIQVVARGEIYVHEDMRPVLKPIPCPEPLVEAQPIDSLTLEETGVLRLLALGHTNRQIADELGVDLNGVDTLRNAIGDKLGVRSRIALIECARRNHLL